MIPLDRIGPSLAEQRHKADRAYRGLHKRALHFRRPSLRPFVCLRDQKDRFLSYPFGVGLTDGGATPPVGKGKDRSRDQDRQEGTRGKQASRQAGREANSRLPSEEEKEEED